MLGKTCSCDLSIPSTLPLRVSLSVCYNRFRTLALPPKYTTAVRLFPSGETQKPSSQGTRSVLTTEPTAQGCTAHPTLFLFPSHAASEILFLSKRRWPTMISPLYSQEVMSFFAQNFTFK